jgi:phosphopantothenoylcysteine decarboxylase/phosphopantothenate--cysteine ligase
VKGARIFLGVSGGIAAYKAAALTSTLVQAGALVDVVLTEEAARFVGPLTFSALTARPVYTSLWDAPERIPHIRLIREADIALIVPATANLIAKLAHGIADDLLTTALLASRIPILVAPAMNEAMYAHAATRANLATLRGRGIESIDPERGFLAEREIGVGRLASEETIVAAVARALQRRASLAGKRVVITAGPTREAFDPVRFVSNASTGSTGIALAAEAARRGGEVTLLLGPTLLEAPGGVRVERFETADQLRDLALKHAAAADLVIATAAVADWKPAAYSPHKLKKEGERLTLEFVRTPDVLALLGERTGTTVLVGFAAETDQHERHAREKLRAKHLDAIVVNDVGEERGFGTGENTLSLLWGDDGRRDLGTAGKNELAARLLDALEEVVPCS